MGAILIKTNDASELRFIKEMLKRVRIKNKELKDDEYEDFLFGIMMKSNKTGKTVLKETITKKLQSK
jgi:hypothetical protein